MMHEDFYKFGTFISEEAGLAVGWVTHPGSFSDCMPVWNEEKNVCLIFTGEDYRDCSGLDRLRTEGHQFSAQNASYLVHQYEDPGCKFLERVNGWFSGLICDFREHKAFLFNDRYEIGRICYHEHEGRFYFSSEAKSLLKIATSTFSGSSKPPSSIRIDVGAQLANDFHPKAGMKFLIESFYRSVVENAPLPIPYREIVLTSQIMDNIFRGWIQIRSVLRIWNIFSIRPVCRPRNQPRDNEKPICLLR